MFPSLRTSTLAQRTLGALDLARSFLMLEDDYDVDWEVDEDEPTQAHPHRVPLRESRRWRSASARRPGELVPPAAVCLSPVTPANGPARRTPASRKRAERLRPQSHR
jgi:hypothetical protein